MEIYENSKKLYNNGFGIKEISHKLFSEYKIQVPKDTIYRWVKNRNKPNGTFNVFVPKMSSELSYIVGVLFGDGTIRIRPQYYDYSIRLKVKDKDFAETFSMALAKTLNKPKPYLISKEKDFTRGNRLRYVCEGGSKSLIEFLSKPMSELLYFINPYYIDFLRGIFDSEGFTSITATKKFIVGAGMANTNLELLQFVKSTLDKEFGIASSIMLSMKKDEKVRIWGRNYKANKNVYTLIIRNSRVKQFHEKIGFTIKRKQEKLKEALDLLEGSSSNEVALEKWRKNYTKVGREWRKIINSEGSPEG